MKVALVAIGRLENKYAVEFVEYYKQLGFDKIFIIDNNRDGEEYFEDVLQSYINEDFVNILNYRNVKCSTDHPSIQIEAYNKAYEIYKDQYDYIMFIDFDEYLCLKKDNNIKEYLNRNVDEYDCILINWMVMTDNNLIYDDGRSLIKRFIRPANLNIKISCDIPENYFVKSIIRCGKQIHMYDPHIPNFRKDNITICNNNFKKLEYTDIINYAFVKYDYTLAYIKHFYTKTIDEYIHNKLKRGVPDRQFESVKEKYNLNLFFKINYKTEKHKKYLIDNNYEKFK